MKPRMPLRLLSKPLDATALAGALALGLVLVFFLSSPGPAQNRDLPAMDCVIAPQVVVDVSSATPGLLEEVLVDRSDAVEEGQVLARLDSKVERAAVAYARERASLESGVAIEQANVGLERRTQDRVASLYERSAVSLQTKDEAETEASVSNLRLRQAREEKKLRELDLRRAWASLSRRTVRSPSGGVVVQRYKQAGEYVEHEPILRIARLDPLRVEAIVPVGLLDDIREGLEADLTTERSPHLTHRATVDAVDPIADAASGTFGVRLTLANTEHRIAAGQKCQLRFVSGSGTEAVSSPPPVEPSEEGAAQGASSAPAEEAPTRRSGSAPTGG